MSIKDEMNFTIEVPKKRARNALHLAGLQGFALRGRKHPKKKDRPRNKRVDINEES